MISYPVIALLTIVCMVTYSFEIIFGLAGTIMMLMVMTYFISAKTLVIYSVMPQLMVAMIGLARSPKTVELRFLGGMLTFAIMGSVLGLILFYYFSSTVFQMMLATAISIFGLYLVLSPGVIKFSQGVNRTLDTLAGMSQALFGISGPIAMTRLIGSFRDKTIIRNYALAFFMSLNLFRAGGYLVNHTIGHDVWTMMAVSAPFLAVTLWFSNRFHFHINEKLFRKVVSWIILVGGISLFFSG
jgi:uncharacterized membrane protein YfcA